MDMGAPQFFGKGWSQRLPNANLLSLPCERCFHDKGRLFCIVSITNNRILFTKL